MKLKCLSGIWPLLTTLIAGSPQRLAAGAVDIYGEAATAGNLVTVNLYADIIKGPLVSFGVRLLYDSRQVVAAEATKNSSVWFFSDGKNRYPYRDPDLTTPGEILIVGGKLDGANPLEGVTGNRVLLGTAIFKSLTGVEPKFDLVMGYPLPYQNFVTAGGIILDNITGLVEFKGVSPAPVESKVRLSLHRNTDGILTLMVIGTAGKQYTIETSPDMQNWSVVETGIANSDGILQWVEKNQGMQARFFRARE
jgi:hypothetical protein